MRKTIYPESKAWLLLRLCYHIPRSFKYTEMLGKEGGGGSAYENNPPDTLCKRLCAVEVITFNSRDVKKILKITFLKYIIS